VKWSNGQYAAILVGMVVFFIVAGSVHTTLGQLVSQQGAEPANVTNEIQQGIRNANYISNYSACQKSIA